jgi:hypothetical protein
LAFEAARHVREPHFGIEAISEAIGIGDHIDEDLAELRVRPRTRIAFLDRRASARESGRREARDEE